MPTTAVIKGQLKNCICVVADCSSRMVIIRAGHKRMASNYRQTDKLLELEG